MADLNLVTKSLESKPALSAKIVGNCLNALANDSMANAFLPVSLAAIWSTAFDIIISEHPPPKQVFGSLVVCDNTDKASCNDLSASSKPCSVAPLNTIVHASPAATPENFNILSSPINTSSIDLQYPNLTFSGESKVDTTSPPVTKANLSTPSKSACSMELILASVNNDSG